MDQVISEKKKLQDLMIEAIKTNNMALFLNIIKRNSNISNELLQKYYYPLHLACEYG